MKPAVKIIVKAIVSAYLLYFAYQILSAQDFYQFAEVDYLKNINIIFHEAGHTLFALFGDFLFALGGSLTQILIPLALAIYFFFWRKETFSGGVVLFWAGESIIDVSYYIADAQKTLLPLLGNPRTQGAEQSPYDGNSEGGPDGHDWNYLLNSFGILDKTDAIASMAFLFGTLIFISAFCAMTFSLYKDLRDLKT